MPTEEEPFQGEDADRLSSTGFPLIKIRRFHGRLIFIGGMPMPGEPYGLYCQAIKPYMMDKNKLTEQNISWEQVCE